MKLMYQEIILYLTMHSDNDWVRLYDIEPAQVNSLQSYLWEELDESVADQPHVWLEQKIKEFLA